VLASCVFSVLLSINIVSINAYLTDLLPSPSVGLCVGLSVCQLVCLSGKCCGKTADWMQMLLVLMSGVSRGMGVLDGGSDRRRGRASFGVNLGHPIVINGTLLHSCVRATCSSQMSLWRTC